MFLGRVFSTLKNFIFFGSLCGKKERKSMTCIKKEGVINKSWWGILMQAKIGLFVYIIISLIVK
jgi:hypothetical protein